MTCIGDMYLDGNGVEQDDAQAAHWYRMGALENDEDAQEKLSMLYREGRGVEQNLELADQWYAISQEQDYATALAMMEELIAAE